MLIALCGLPGAGKSVLADDLGRRTGWPVLSVDPVEHALQVAGIARDQPTGLAAYVVVEALADRLLRLGQRAVVDAVNDAEEARGQWTGLARRHGRPCRFVEVVCSDPVEHRRRLESRVRDLGDFAEPTWESLAPRRARLVAWTGQRVVIDSLGDRDANVTRVLDLLA